MPVLHIILVAIVQGITEFLPVSSSAHLILLPALTGLDDQGLAIDVAVHVGTLGAVVLYFRKDVGEAAHGVVELLAGRPESRGAFLALCLIVASIPAVVLGAVIVLTGLAEALRSVALIGWTTLIFGLLLYWADQRGAEAREAETWTLRHALAMGLWQAMALVPGVSRSGITITGARLLGYRRHDAARLAMLMSVPTIAAAGVLQAAELVGQANWAVLRDGAIAAAFAFLSALAALSLMMRLLRSVSYTPYVVYRVFLGAALLVYAYGIA